MSRLNFIGQSRCETVIGLLLGVMACLLFASPWRANGQGGANSVTTVSAASFAPVVTPDSIAAAFGTRLATRTELATSQPLPKSLAGATVRVNGEFAPLFFVSETQVNFLIPPGTPTGSASIVITSGDGTVSQGTAQITTVAPALFTANSNGLGPLASQILRVKANGELVYQQLAQYSESEKRFVTKAFDFGEPSDQLFLVLYLTGVRQAALSNVRVNIGGVEYVPSGIAPVQGFTGLDQINVPLPRTFGGRGSIKLLVRASGSSSSNEGEFEIGSAASGAALQITRVPSSPVLVTEEIEIGGSGFAANPLENTVLIVANDGVTTKADVLGVAGDALRVRVPFGAGAGQIRISRSQSEASAGIQVRTSVSGFVQEFRDGARVAVVGLPIALREPSGRRIETTTDANGSFVMRDAEASPLSIIDLAGRAMDGANYPAQTRKMTVRASRDNQYKGDGDLANIIEIKRNGAAASSLLTENTPVSETVIASEPEDTIKSGPVTFETNNSTITFPGGGSGQLTLTVLDLGRTPANLPVFHFSSTIAQITPFGARLNPGGKLTFPNSDAIPAGTKARLFKFDQTTGQETVGQFIDVGEATVSADGQRVETAPNAITETSYYFVSIPRPLAAINGRVLESDGRPAPRAVVNARGQSAFTDGFGGFVLRNVPVLKSIGDRVKVEVSYQRPDGTISRKESNEVELTANQLATVKPEITLEAATKNFPPVILAPASLTITAGEPRDFDLNIVDQASGQTTQVNQSGNATAFTTLINQGNGLYRLRLSPGADAAGSYTLTLSATDSAHVSVQNIAITVIQTDNARPTGQSQSVTTLEDSPKQITLAGRDPGGRTLNYIIVTQPARGSLSGGAPNLTYAPARDFNGVDSFTFKVSNGTAESQPATVFIAVTPVNDRPFVNLPGPQELNAGESLNLVVTAIDVDGDQSLNLSVAGLPAGATFQQTSATSRLLNWTPTPAQAGRYVLTFTATDPKGLSATESLVITVSAKWAKTSGPEGGEIRAFLGAGGTIYSGSHGAGVFRSTDNGRSWVEVSRGLSGQALYVNDLLLRSTTLFAATAGGVYVSTDNALNWFPLNFGIPADALFITSLIESEGILYAGSSSGGVYRYDDRARSWRAVNTGLAGDALKINALLRVGGTLYAGTFGGGVYRSSNGGETWGADNLGLTGLSVFITTLAAKEMALYAGTFSRGVYRSIDGGRSWVAINRGFPNEEVRVNTVQLIGTSIFAGTYGSGVYRLNETDGSWSPLNNGLSGLAVYVNRLFLGGNNFLAGTLEGIYRSIDLGQQWSRATAGLVASSVPALLNHPSGLYAGTSGGIFRSNNNGQSWAPLNNGLSGDGFRINALIALGNIFYAGSYGGGVYRSNDAGQNWSPVNNGLTDRGLFVYGLIASGSTLYAGTDGGGVYRSNDGGQSWAAINAGLPARAIIFSLQSIGSTLYAGSFGGGVYRWIENEQRWVALSTGLAGEALNVLTLAAAGNQLYAGTRGGVYRLAENGLVWTPVNNGLSGDALFILELSATGNLLYAGTRGGVYRLNDDGQGWTQVGSNLVNPYVVSLAVIGARLFAGTDGNGVSLLADAAQSWTAVNSGLSNSFVNSIAVDGNSLYSGTLGGGVFRAAPSDPRWSPVNSGLPVNVNIQSTAAHSSMVWAGTFGDGVFRSADQGANWNPISSGLTSRFVNKIFVNGSTVYAGTDGGVFRLIDGSNSWSAINTNLSNLRVVSFTSNAGVVYIGTDGGGVFRLNPDGVSWTRVSNGLTSQSVTALGVSNSVLYAGTSGGGICVSRDGGDSWTAVNNQLPSNLNVYGFAASGKKVFAGSIYGVFVTEDEGQNWKQVNAGLLDVYVTGLAVSGDQLFASTASGGVFVSYIP